jgi:hypothetical protein
VQVNERLPWLPYNEARSSISQKVTLEAWRFVATALTVDNEDSSSLQLFAIKRRNSPIRCDFQHITSVRIKFTLINMKKRGKRAVVNNWTFEIVFVFVAFHIRPNIQLSSHNMLNGYFSDWVGFLIMFHSFALALCIAEQFFTFLLPLNTQMKAIKKEEILV